MLYLNQIWLIVHNIGKTLIWKASLCRNTLNAHILWSRSLSCVWGGGGIDLCITWQSPKSARASWSGSALRASACFLSYHPPPEARGKLSHQPLSYYYNALQPAKASAHIQPWFKHITEWMIACDSIKDWFHCFEDLIAGLVKLVQMRI